MKFQDLQKSAVVQVILIENNMWPILSKIAITLTGIHNMPLKLRNSGRKMVHKDDKYKSILWSSEA